MISLQVHQHDFELIDDDNVTATIEPDVSYANFYFLCCFFFNSKFKFILFPAYQFQQNFFYIIIRLKN